MVDSSAAIDALLAVPGSGALRTLLATEELHAPTLIDVEVVSALRGLTRGGRISATRAQDLLTDLDDLPLRRWPSSDGLRRRSFQLRENVSAYDAAYLALAEALDCPLLTRDARPSRSSGHHVRIDVRQVHAAQKQHPCSAVVPRGIVGAWTPRWM
ncbi:type II toxin-antitoxin system VapC family toxin [Arthrobacter sp.]|uniref:type II toxin-antitoxin system VapC family toxin n=1 Tax=Arthrobacter sp. TaxID=1667 RepID=UPI003A8CD8F5